MTGTDKQEQYEHWEKETKLLTWVLRLLLMSIVGGATAIYVGAQWIQRVDSRFEAQIISMDAIRNDMDRRFDENSTQYIRLRERLAATEAVTQVQETRSARTEERLISLAEQVERMNRQLGEALTMFRNGR